MITIVGNFISEEDVKVVSEYIKSVKFHTREDHVPLHNNLFENEGTTFDIHTRGEMPDHILAIFSKYSKGFYELVQAEEDSEYHPPMFSKHYIARYPKGSDSQPHTDNSKPEGTYGSYIVWNSDYTGGLIEFPELGQKFKAVPGDLIYFKEMPENARGITGIESGYMFVSEAWMGKKGQHFMPNKASYEEVQWDDWEIKGF
jgi:hypothetical protein